MLSIRAEDTVLKDSDGSVLFSYDDYYWNFQLSSLFNRAWTFREIRLEGLLLNMERFEIGDHRFGRLTDSFPTKEKDGTGAEPGSEKGGLPRLIIHEFRLIDGRLAVSDHVHALDYHAELGPINIQVTDLKTLPDESGRQSVSIVTEDGGAIAWQGSLQLVPLHSQGKFTIEGRKLSEAHRYLDLLLPFTTSGKAVSAAFDYKLSGNEDGSIELAVDGLDVEAHDFELTVPEEEQSILSLPVLKLTGGSLRWPQQTASLERLNISGLELNAHLKEGGGFSLIDLAPGNDSGQGEQLDEKDGAEPWQVDLKAFAIDDATINLQDRTMSPAVNLKLEALSLGVEDISNREGERFPTALSFNLASGGTANFSGQAGVLPSFSVEGELQLDGIQMQVMQPYVSKRANVNIESGEVDVKGTISSNDENPAAYAGSVYLRAFDLSDTLRNEKLAGWSLLDIDRADFSLAGDELTISELELVRPYGRVHIAEDLTTNIGDLIIEPEADEPSGENGGKEPMAVTIGGIVIDDANLDFSDDSLPLPFSAAISSMGGDISTLSTTSSQPAEISLEGQVNEYGLARIGGSIDVWALMEHTDIQLTFRNLEMSRLSPYTIQFAGHAIDGGRMDLDLDYRISSQQLDAQNQIVIRDIRLGEKVEHPDAASLPLGLAIALLKDSEGVIDIELPVSGDLSDPEFSYGGIVAKAIFNLITKIVTSPFRLLGNLVGFDSEDFGTLEFQPGDALVSPPDLEKLVKLTEAMQMRPGLTLEVIGVYEPALDSAALKEQAVEALIEARTEAEEAAGAELSIALRRSVTEALITEAFPEISLESVQAEFMSGGDSQSGAAPKLDEIAYIAALRQRLIDQQHIREPELAALAEARAAAIMSAISPDGGTSSAQVIIGGIEQVSAEDGAAVPLELKVSIEDLPAAESPDL
jgi:hypothetical protein